MTAFFASISLVVGTDGFAGEVCLDCLVFSFVVILVVFAVVVVVTLQ